MRYRAPGQRSKTRKKWPSGRTGQIVVVKERQDDLGMLLLNEATIRTIFSHRPCVLSSCLLSPFSRDVQGKPLIPDGVERLLEPMSRLGLGPQGDAAVRIAEAVLVLGGKIVRCLNCVRPGGGSSAHTSTM